MLFVSDSVQHVQRIPYKRSSRRIWKLSIRTGNSHLSYGELFMEGKIEGRI